MANTLSEENRKGLVTEGQIAMHTLKTIKSVNELPIEFRTKDYSQKFSLAGWYAEIWDRLQLSKNIDSAIERRSALRSGNSTPKSKNTGKLLDVEIDQLRESIFQQQANLSPKPTIKINEPISNLAVLEVAYLYSCIYERDRDSASFMERLRHALEPLLGEGGDELMALHRADLATLFFDLTGDAGHFGYLWKNAEAFRDRKIEELFVVGLPIRGSTLIIDTDYDDGTLEAAFKTWLRQKRLESGRRAHRPVNDADLEKWSSGKVRELFDLEMWSKLVEVNILDRVMADALWQYDNSDFSPIDFLRKTARKTMKSVVSPEMCIRLAGQMRTEGSKKN